MTDSSVGPNDAPPMPVGLRVGEGASWVQWNLSLRADGLQFMRERESVEIKDADLSGIVTADSTVSLHSTSGATVHLQGGPQLAEAASVVSARICTLHEVTRPLRAFGARRGRPGDEHDHFFEPLMSARLQAESAQNVAGRIAAFDAALLRSAIDRALQAFATSRFPSALPEQRALYETLNEQVQELYGALDQLRVAAHAARNAPDTERFTRWRDWLKAVEGTFVAADECWLRIVPLLDRVGVAGPKGLSRLFRKLR